MIRITGGARIIPALAGNTRVHDPHYGRRKDHPRSRGEYRPLCRLPAFGFGSSPLSRGIPSPLPGRVVTSTDHPRSRGEYQGCGDQETRHGGSSPLSRGILAVVDVAPQVGRIIPALAGNTFAKTLTIMTRTDHPRSRGEYDPVTFKVPGSAGSSPLSRGIPKRKKLTLLVRRIIPALAGNTKPSMAFPNRHWDHPRSRGEYPGVSGQLGGDFGSSPLSRGIQGVSGHGRKHVGIIPALAGDTWKKEYNFDYATDHPRSRGEYILRKCVPRYSVGSSPLSRGIRCP